MIIRRCLFEKRERTHENTRRTIEVLTSDEICTNDV